MSIFPLVLLTSRSLEAHFFLFDRHCSRFPSQLLPVFSPYGCFYHIFPAFRKRLPSERGRPSEPSYELGKKRKPQERMRRLTPDAVSQGRWAVCVRRASDCQRVAWPAAGTIQAASRTQGQVNMTACNFFSVLFLFRAKC